MGEAEALGPVDHKGIIESIYFHDPNGIRLELTRPVDPDWNRHGAEGRAALERWLAAKAAARQQGRDPTEALLALIRDLKRERHAAGNG